MDSDVLVAVTSVLVTQLKLEDALFVQKNKICIGSSIRPVLGQIFLLKTWQCLGQLNNER